MAIVFLRTIIVFTVIIVSMRLMGKRLLGELELSELVVAVLISDMAAHPLQDIGIPLFNGLIPVFTLLGCELLITAGTMKNIKFRAVICGTPSILVQNGKINQKEMAKNRFTIDELMEELRNKGITDISTIQYAILETDGTLNTLLYPAEKPVTAAVMGVKTQEFSLPSIVINDGRIMTKNLSILGFDEKWLKNQLKILKISDPKDVYMMTADKSQKIYYSLKEKK